jgi:hypothetical protein
MLKKTAHLLWVLLFAALAAGCATTATIKTNEFAAYHDAVETLSAGSAEALAYEREWTYRNYLAQFTEGGPASPADLILDFPTGPGAPFASALPDAPQYMAIRDTETRLAELNKLFSDYTVLLMDLAGADAKDADRIKNLGEALNKNSLSAAQALGVHVGAKPVALFSAAATTAAQAYVNHHRRESLQTVLRDNQPAVDAFARLGADAASISAVGIKTEYQNDTKRWVNRYAKAAASKRPKLIEEQLALNERTIAQLDALRKIHDGYLLLARKHAELASSVVTGNAVDLRRLIDNGRELRDLYKRLRAAGEAKSNASKE